LDGWIDDATTSLLDHGWAVRYAAVSRAGIAKLFDELEALVALNRLKRAGVGRDRDYQIDRDARRDWIHWLSRRRPVQAEFLDWAEQLRLALNRLLFLGLFEFEAHLALYPKGAFYVRHYDSFTGAANRMVSLVLYLNRHWQPGDGGELVLYAPDTASEITRVEPRAGTLVLFMSEEVEHQVLPTRVPRASVSGWFRLNNNSAALVDPPS
jgi:SM-20-related protein